MAEGAQVARFNCNQAHGRPRPYKPPEAIGPATQLGHPCVAAVGLGEEHEECSVRMHEQHLDE
tara:strand:+ start:223 stop:411 length:189 start_codon:yes stop_codon:yes gene_type:complete